ncbi:MAG: hypothetical protein ACR2F6_16290 [Mycobacteriales bacterium]
MITSRRESATARAALTAVAVLGLSAAVTACGHQSRSDFASAADSACRQSVDAIKDIDPDSSGSPRQYGIDYFTAYDRLLAQLGDIAMPAHDEDRIRSEWIAPARADLAALRPKLALLPARSADGRPAGTQAILAEVRSIGANDVDAGYVRSLGARDCVPVFSGGLA